MSSVIDAIVHITDALGVVGIGILSFLENIILIIPSEVVLPLAGFTAEQGQMGFWSAFWWATIGTVLGAWVQYWVGRCIGAERMRRLVDRLPLMEGGDVDAAMHWFNKWGIYSVFFCRLLPGLRGWISLPAGFARMNQGLFLLYTFLGTAIWDVVLMYFGYVLGNQYDKVQEHFDKFSLVVGIACALLVGWGIWSLVRRSRRRRSSRVVVSSLPTPLDEQQQHTSPPKA